MHHSRMVLAPTVALLLALVTLLLGCASTPDAAHPDPAARADPLPVLSSAGGAQPTAAESDVPAPDPASGSLEEADSPDRFRFTTLRFWLFRDFLPKSDDADILGIETNAAWGIGDYDFTNISYIEFADYPRAVPGRPAGNAFPLGIEGATGITDLLTATLASPKSAHHGPHHFSAGLALQFPTATDDTLGAGKWSAGPAVEYEYHQDRFFAAFVALQIWSYAGDPDRKSVNMMMIKPMITYELVDHLKAVYMPYGISIYWNKDPGERAYVPLGGGLQYDFSIGSQTTAVSLQFFKYVVRPSAGSEYDLRLMIEFDF